MFDCYRLLCHWSSPCLWAALLTTMTTVTCSCPPGAKPPPSSTPTRPREAGPYQHSPPPETNNSHRIVIKGSLALSTSGLNNNGFHHSILIFIKYLSKCHILSQCSWWLIFPTKYKISSIRCSSVVFGIFSQDHRLKVITFFKNFTKMLSTLGKNA